MDAPEPPQNSKDTTLAENGEALPRHSSPFDGKITPPETALDGTPRGEVFDWVDTAMAKRPTPVWGWPLVMGLAALGYCLYLFGAINGANSRQPMPIGPFPAATPAKIRVQIAGMVRKPGVYELTADARIQDLLKKAGGALPKADIGALNLAAWPEDGAKIVIPARASAKPTPTPIIIVERVEVPVEVPIEVPATSSEETRELAPLAAPRSASKAADVPRTTTKSGAKSSNASPEFLRKNPLDLNRAPAAQLEQLPGIGPTTAERIIAYRQENGGFKSVAELDQVKGIGETRMAKLKGLVYVR